MEPRARAWIAASALSALSACSRDGGGAVTVERGADEIAIAVAGRPFTRYRCLGDDPCCFPVLTPAGVSVTRGYPFATVPGEAADHPHHRSLWFAHGSVGGQDFWHEGQESVRTAAVRELQSDPAHAGFEAESEWRGAAGELLARDVRRIFAFALERGAGLDFEITLAPAAGTIDIGDTKEGTFALRLAAGLAVDEGGALSDSEGRSGAGVWGRRARWVLATGSTGGARVAVALLDHPDNLRHPTTWHARTYGLIAANPFGLADFEGAPAGSGAVAITAGAPLHLRYRVLALDGELDLEVLERQYREFAARP